jgi:hypothetical protein
MVQEKVDAAIEGAFCRADSLGPFSSKPRSAVCGRPTTFPLASPLSPKRPLRLPGAVRANARRLTGAKASP